MRNSLALTALAGALMIGGAAFAQDTTTETETEAPAAETTEPAADPAAEPAAPVEIQDMVLGDPNAPVTIIEYGSFTCPHCANFHANQFQSLNADYIESGQVNFIFREVYFDRFGLWASMIARCGGEMRFYGIHDILYETQADWIAGGQDPALIADNLRTIGIQAGLDGAQVDACMQDEATAQALVAWFETNATADEISATPTLIIDGTKYSNMSYEEMQPIIEAALAE